MPQLTIYELDRNVGTLSFDGDKLSFDAAVRLDNGMSLKQLLQSLPRPDASTDNPAAFKQAFFDNIPAYLGYGRIQADPGVEDRTDDATPTKRIIDWQGYKLGLQYQPFDTRHGKVLPVAYGHIQKTKGADGMAVDCYVGANLESDRLWEITQLVNGQFDEHKLMIGFDSEAHATQTYLKLMPLEMFGGMRELPLSALADYRTDDAATQPRDEHGRFAGAGGAMKTVAGSGAAAAAGHFIGGAIAGFASHHGIHPELAHVVSEVGVKALTATAIFAQGGDRSPKEIAAKFMLEASAGAVGKLTGTHFNDLLSGVGGDAHIKGIVELVNQHLGTSLGTEHGRTAAKLATTIGSGVGTSQSLSKSGLADRVAEAMSTQGQQIKALLGRGVANQLHHDAADGDLSEIETAALVDLTIAGLLLANQTTSSKTDATEVSDATAPFAQTGGTSRTDATNPILTILERADRHLSGLEDSAIERVNSALESAYQDLEETILRRYSQETPGSLMARDRALVLLSQVTDLLTLLNTRNADDIQQAFEDLLRGADAQGVTLAQDLTRAIANQSLQMTANVPLAAISNQATEGMTRLRNHTDAFADKASTIVTQGIIQGFSTDKVASLLQRELGVVRHKAETIARTESLSASNSSAIANYQANGINLGTWQATQDLLLCPFCAARNQKIYRLDELVIPAHPRCLPGDIVVSGAGVKAGTFRQYTGEVVVIKTASGKELTATPNHPVLTNKGWVAIDLIQKGDHVFSSVNREDIPSAITPDDYQRPTSISEVVATLRESPSMMSRSVKVSPEDFDGDGKGSEVCVISTDRLLWDQANSQLIEPGIQLSLKRGLIGAGALPADRLPTLHLPGQSLALHCGMCRSSLPSPLFGSHGAPLKTLSIGSVSHSHTSSNQLIADHLTTDTQLLGQGIFGRASNVCRDSESSIEVNSFAPDGYASFDQAIVDSRTTDTKLLAQAVFRPASSVFGDDITIVDRECLSTQPNASSLKPLSHARMADTNLSSQLTGGLTSLIPVDETLADRMLSGSILDIDASSLEALVKTGDIDNVTFSDRGDSLTSLIRRDEVIHIERRNFSDHVYNLETKTGWYFANSIVTHNCRCFASPASESWLRLGLIDTKWATEFRSKSLTELRSQGLEPNDGLTPFEKANGMNVPVPVWEPE